MQTQLDAYKKSTELNIQLITDLRAKLEAATNDSQAKIATKDIEIKSMKDAYSLLNTQLIEMKLRNEGMASKLSDAEKQVAQCQTPDEKLDQMKSRMKKVYQSELEKVKRENDMRVADCQRATQKAEEALKSVENEFRAALIIEANRYNELFGKYEAANKVGLFD